MLKKIVSLLIFSIFTVSVMGCHSKNDKNTIIVGTIDGPETQLMEIAKNVALKNDGLHVKIIAFTDYNTPNAALAEGSLDANAFQHVPYLNSQIKAHGYKLIVIGKTFIYPMAVYSKKLKTLAELPEHATVAIPNDPSNEARALLLLQRANLITLKPNVSINATILDIKDNPKQIKFVELDAAELPRALADVSAAVINTNYAIPAGLSPTKDALIIENKDSLYANVVVARDDNQSDPRLQQLLSALHSKEVIDGAKEIFGDGALPAWDDQAAQNH